MKNYTDLNVWIKTRELATNCYELTKKFSKDEMFGLSSQIRRSAVSIPSNIAEGCGRNTSKATNQFLFIARGSLYELETQCLISNDLNLIDEPTLKSVIDKITECKRLLNGFINYYNNIEASK